MKKTLNIAVVVMICIGTIVTAYAQPKPEFKKRFERQTEKLSKALSLSSEQLSKLEQINEESLKKIESEKPKAEEIKDKLKMINEDRITKINKILTTEQKEKFDKIKTNWREKNEKMDKRRKK